MQSESSHPQRGVWMLCDQRGSLSRWAGAGGNSSKAHQEFVITEFGDAAANLAVVIQGKREGLCFPWF